MHPAAQLQFDRTARGYWKWRTVPADEQSPAPGWWWQPAFEVLARSEVMLEQTCLYLELPISSSYAAGAAKLMSALADQTSLAWPDEFPRKIPRKSEI
jgi:hypothetical protein